MVVFTGGGGIINGTIYYKYYYCVACNFTVKLWVA